MTIFGRYLAREVYSAIFLILLAFLSLFMFFDMLQEIDEIRRPDYTFVMAFTYTLLISLGRTYELLPITVLIGALYTLSRFAARSEFTVARTSGLSTRQAITMVLTIGLPMVLLTFVFGEVIAPVTEDIALNLKSVATGKAANAKYGMESGFWAHDGNTIVNVSRVLPGNRAEAMRLYEFGDDFEIKSIHAAKEARFIPHTGWHLSSVNFTRFEKEKVISGYAKDHLWPSGLDATILSISTSNPDRMTAHKLFEYSQRLSDNRENNDRYVVALWKKLVYPFTCLVMMIIALPMAYQQHRAQTTSLSLFIGILLGITFYMLNALSNSLGVLNSWPAPIAASLPALIFLLIGVTILWRTSR